MTSSRRASAIALALFVAAAASGLAAEAERAVLVSVPGLSAPELEALWRAGALDGGGFAPFFERGEVGPGLRLVDPVLPTPAAWAVASGQPPGQSGAVAERWRPAGAALDVRQEIATAPLPKSTLWVAASAADRRVGAVLWPGLDNSEELRRVDWGVSPVTVEHFPSRSIRLARDRWTDNAYGKGPGPSLYWSLPKSVPSYSTPLTFSVPFMVPHERHELIYDVIAVDRTDDGVVNYDAVIVTSDVNPSKGYVGTIEPGDWLRLELPLASGSRKGAIETAWIKLIDLDPELEHTWFYVSGTYFSRYHPAALVRRLDALSTAHPGPLDEHALVLGLKDGFGIDEATFVEQGERLAAFAVDATLQGLAIAPTDLTLVELPVFVAARRRLELGDPRHPGYTPELAERLRSARRELIRAVDRQLGRLLAGLDLDRTAVFLVSAYDAIPAHSDVDIGDLLHAAPALASLRKSGPPVWSVETEEGFAHVYLAVRGRDPDGVIEPRDAKRVAKEVRDAFLAVRDDGQPVFERVLLRSEARRLGLDHPNAGDVIAFARPGYRLTFGSKNPAVVERTTNVDAVGGQLASSRVADGLWLALGPGIAPRRLSTPPKATDVAPRIARTLGIQLPRR
ncbi:MAG: alkaline phosphatase family protein [Holophagales bacterium]|nr:alkaline phosphatase family protein [Holophagales bacterium]